MRKHKKPLVVPLMTAALLLSGGAAIEAAPVMPRDDAGIELRRQREEAERERVRQQMEEDRRQQAEGVQDETGKPAAPAESEVKFLLNDVTCDPSEIIGEEKVREIASEYIGKEVSIAELNELVQKLNDIYAAGGYITCKAYLAPQTIENGIVHIGLLEGTVGEVEVSGNKHTNEKFVRHRLSLAEGSIPRLGTLNDELFRFNSTNDAPLRVTMKAGKAPGTTDFAIVVHEPPKNDTATLFVDNTGNTTTGQWREGIYYTNRSLTDRRDSLSLGYTHAKGLNSASISYSVPVGRKGARMMLDYSTSASDLIEKSLRNLDSHGHGWYAGLSYLRPLILNPTTRTEARIGFYRQNSQTDMLGGAARWIDNSANNLYASFAMTSYGKTSAFYHRHYYGIGHANAYSVTEDKYGSRNYGLYRLNSFYQKTWRNGHLLTARLDAQWSSTKSLPSAEQFFLGGAYSVRGYKQDLISGDNGMTFGVEYAVPVDKKRTTSVYGFLDYGTLLGSTAYDDHTLASLGLGIRTSLRRGPGSDQRLFMNLSLGFPLKRNLNGTKVSKTQLHFTMNMQF